MKQIKLFLGVIAMFIFLHACKGKNEKCSNPTTISFKNDVQPIFNENCITSGCHSGNNPAGNLNLSSQVSFQNLIDSQSGYLDLNTPKNSLLYTSMTSVNNPMPPNGKLSNCKLDLILKWIEQGANNN